LYTGITRGQGQAKNWSIEALNYDAKVNEDPDTFMQN
jgi:hypothetical protein